MSIRSVSCFAMTLWLAGVSPGDAAPVDVVLEWNANALNAVANDFSDPNHSPEQGGPTKTARALAMVHAAMFDACNSIDGSYRPYLISVPMSQTASLDAAVARAAHDTLCSLYTRQKAVFDSQLGLTLQRIPNGVAKVQGQLVGAVCAQVMLANRTGDGSTDNTPYLPGTLPGEHRVDPLHPNQGFLGCTWGAVKPFAISSVDNYPIAPPPAIDSADYADAYNEIKDVGAKVSPSRTAEQTTVGIFWGYDGTPHLGTPPRMYNQIVTIIAKQQKNTPVQNARLFALVNMALADAGIACWAEKYNYNYWRPILGIREADPGTGPSGLGDDNPDTVGDVNWEPLGAQASNSSGTNFTPNFPSCGSGHATFGGALFQVLRRFYGTDHIPFQFMSDEFNGVTTDQNGVVRPVVVRKYHSLSQAEQENGISRLYLGVHWRFDMTSGITQGEAIGNDIYNTALRPRK